LIARESDEPAGHAGGIYGDILGAAILGDRGTASMLGQLAGPIPGMFGDAVIAASSPLRSALDESGAPDQGYLRKTGSAGNTEAFTADLLYKASCGSVVLGKVADPRRSELSRFLPAGRAGCEETGIGLFLGTR
jgi:hypothetical protein